MTKTHRKDIKGIIQPIPFFISKSSSCRSKRVAFCVILWRMLGFKHHWTTLILIVWTVDFYSISFSLCVCVCFTEKREPCRFGTTGWVNDENFFVSEVNHSFIKHCQMPLCSQLSTSLLLLLYFRLLIPHTVEMKMTMAQQ